MPLTGDTSTLDHYTALHYITLHKYCLSSLSRAARYTAPPSRHTNGEGIIYGLVYRGIEQVIVPYVHGAL